MKPLKTKVSITLDTEVIEEIKEFAEPDDRSFSQYVNLILKDYLKKQGKKRVRSVRILFCRYGKRLAKREFYYSVFGAASAAGVSPAPPVVSMTGVSASFAESALPA